MKNNYYDARAFVERCILSCCTSRQIISSRNLVRSFRSTFVGGKDYLNKVSDYYKLEEMSLRKFKELTHKELYDSLQKG